MKRITFPILALMLVPIAACSDDSEQSEGTGGAYTPPIVINVTAAESQAVEASNGSAYELFDKLYSEEADATVFSPLSLQMAMTMAANGAMDETLEEVLTVLAGEGATLNDLNSLCNKLYTTLPTTDPKTTVKIANSMWHDSKQTFLPTFRQKMGEVMGAAVKSYDKSNPTQAAAAINNWVADNTAGNIKELVNENHINNLILVNALYFKSEWSSKFNKSNTRDESFTNMDFSTTTVPMMHHGGMKGFYTEAGSTQVGAVPFGNKAYYIVFALPERGKTPADAMRDMAEACHVAAPEFNQAEIDIKLPRLKARMRTEQIADIYKELGIKRAFDAQNAQMSEMCPSNVCISDIVHQCVVELDEDGAVAAAATSVGLDATAPTPVFLKPKMVFDHPFAFMIVEASSRTILFMGAVNRM